jgi:hypothetical protein
MRIPIAAVAFFIFHCLCISQSFAQDTIVLLNGRKMPVAKVEVKGEQIFYHPQGSAKTKHMDIYRAFSVLPRGEREQVVYTPDPADTTDLSIEDMRMFVKGQQEARRYYHNTPNKIASAAVGASAGLLAIYGLVIPAAYSTFVAGRAPKPENQIVSEFDLKNNISFRDGYESRARNNKIKNSLIYGFSGFAVGILGYTFLFKH